MGWGWPAAGLGALSVAVRACDPLNEVAIIFITSTIVQVKESESEVAQSCPTLCDPMDCSLLGFPVDGVFQARILEWVAISFSRRSS